MKKRVLLYFTMVVLMAIPQQIMADDIAINETNFPDENFRNWVLAQDYGADGVLTNGERESVTGFSVSYEQIADLKGIEFFTALEWLSCEVNELTTLDLSKNTSLTELYCNDNQLASLDVSKNTLIKILYCNNNQLSSLDVTNNTALTHLDCSNNQLTLLNVSKSTELLWLNCNNNMLASLNMPKNTKLFFLSCNNNQLTSLNVSDNTGLAEFDCSSNNLSTLDVTKITNLSVLNCNGNELSSLDISKNTKLQRLKCSDNILSSLDITNNTALTGLECNSNQLSSLDLSGKKNLVTLLCSDNQLASLDVSKNILLGSLNCAKNQLTSLDVSKNTRLSVLHCYYNNIKGEAMDALVESLPTTTRGQFVAIALNDDNEQNVITKAQVSVAEEKGWTVYDSSIHKYEGSGPESEGIAIDETNFPDENFRNWVLAQDYGLDGVLTEEEIAGVTFIDVSEKNIASLKGIEYFTALTQLDCYENQLTSLDVSKNTVLTWLSCDNNQLTSLDVSKNTALMGLTCGGNQLTLLDVSKNTALENLYCNYNQLTSLDVSNNTALKTLYCSYNQLTSLHVSKKTALWLLTCDNNRIDETEMGNLVESLPTNNGSIYVKRLNDATEQNVITTAQVAAAKAKSWTVYAWDSNVGDYGGWVEYDGDEPQEIAPVEQGETIDIGNEIDENTNLDGNVVGDVYYCISSGDGSYDPEEGCLVVTKPTDDSVIDGKDIFGEDFKDNYAGFMFMVAPGKGSIKVEAQTIGNMVLKVKVGDNAPAQMEVNGKTKVSFSYDVSEPTMVFIYGSIAAAGAKGMRKVSGTDMLKIYGIEVTSETDGIEAIDNGQLTIDNSPVYNISGQRVSNPGKGVFIKYGKKVLVK